MHLPNECYGPPRIVARVRLLAAMWAFSLCSAQNPGTPHFDVASVKPEPPDAMRFMDGGPGTNDPDRVLISASLRDLIGGAYRDEYADRISGPSWLDSRFIVRATLPHGSTQKQFQEMTKTLLAERFLLKFHTTVVGQSPAYELVVGPKGSKIATQAPAQAKVVGQDKSSTGAFGPESAMKWVQRRTADGNQLMTFRKCSTGYLAERLSFCFSAHKVPVIDRTGIAGEFDFQFEFPPDLNATAPTMDDPFGRLRLADPTTLRRVSPLLEKQLGFRLNPTKVDLKNMIIDHVERVPTAN